MTTGFARVLVGNELVNETSKALNSLRQLGNEFTAHQVTQAVRKSVGPTVEVIHNDVRQIVHNYMNTVTSYEEFSKSYGSTTARAYRPRQRTTQVSPAVPVVKNTGITPATNLGTFVAYMTPKSEGRVTVPASALKKIGVKPNDNVWLTKCNDLLTLSKVTGHTKYVADKHGSIRLRHKYLNGCKKFKVVVKTDSPPGVVQLVGER